MFGSSAVLFWGTRHMLGQLLQPAHDDPFVLPFFSAIWEGHIGYVAATNSNTQHIHVCTWWSWMVYLYPHTIETSSGPYLVYTHTFPQRKAFDLTSIKNIFVDFVHVKKQKPGGKIITIGIKWKQIECSLHHVCSDWLIPGPNRGWAPWTTLTRHYLNA